FVVLDVSGMAVGENNICAVSTVTVIGIGNVFTRDAVVGMGLQAIHNGENSRWPRFYPGVIDAVLVSLDSLQSLPGKLWQVVTMPEAEHLIAVTTIRGSGTVRGAIYGFLFFC